MLTVAAARRLGGLDAEHLIDRHLRGDWGAVPGALAASNDRALATAGRVRSDFPLPGGGVVCVVTEDAHNFEDMVERACRIACREGFAAPEQSIVVTAGVPLGTPGATNLLRIALIGQNAKAFGTAS